MKKITEWLTEKGVQYEVDENFEGVIRISGRVKARITTHGEEDRYDARIIGLYTGMTFDELTENLTKVLRLK